MDNQEFRGILLKLQDRLSDNDRKCLHFFFGNDVPRRIRDDPSLGGTLSLLESLFDQDKINEQDFTVLIRAFTEIRCLDAAKLLQQHMNQVQKTDQKINLERLSSIMPNTMNQLLEDQQDDDKFNVKNNYIYQENTSSHNNNIIESNNTNINPFTLVLNQHTNSDLPLKQKKFLPNRSIFQMCLIIFTLVSLIILAILTGFYIYRSTRIHELEKDLQTKNQMIIAEKTKNNETVIANKILNNTINDILNEQKSSFMIDGMKIGSVGGNYFDDSLKKNFSCTHHLCGMIARRAFFPSNWFQFLYSSPFYSNSIMESEIHGVRPDKEITERFLLNKDEYVNKIQIVYHNVSYNIDNIIQIVSVIRGIRLFTTKGRSSPSLDNVDGIKIIEEFNEYVVGYISGRAGLSLNQIQFHWFRRTAVN